MLPGNEVVAAAVFLLHFTRIRPDAPVASPAENTDETTGSGTAAICGFIHWTVYATEPRMNANERIYTPKGVLKFVSSQTMSKYVVMHIPL